MRAQREQVRAPHGEVLAEQEQVRVLRVRVHAHPQEVLGRHEHGRVHQVLVQGPVRVPQEPEGSRQVRVLLAQVRLGHSVQEADRHSCRNAFPVKG